MHTIQDVWVPAGQPRSWYQFLGIHLITEIKPGMGHCSWNQRIQFCLHPLMTMTDSPAWSQGQVVGKTTTAHGCLREGKPVFWKTTPPFSRAHCLRSIIIIMASCSPLLSGWIFSFPTTPSHLVPWFRLAPVSTARPPRTPPQNSARTGEHEKTNH